MAASVKATILFIQPRLGDFRSLDTGKELRNLRDSLLTELHGNSLDWQVLPDARVRDLVWALRYYEPAIVHYAGHGSSYGDLYFDPEVDKDESVRVTAENFAEILGAYQEEARQKVRLAVLAACHTARSARLVAQHVDCVVGMEGEPDDAALASTFTPSLYAALAGGRSVANAVDITVAQLGVDHAEDAKMVQVFPKNGIDPATLRVADMVQQPPSFVHMQYLERLFGKPWASVHLAELLADRDEEAKLLDVYVPLRVDFGITIKTEGDTIVNWWVEKENYQALPGRELALDAKEQEDTAAPTELRTRLRAWSELRVDEDGLQDIVDGVQRKIRRRRESDGKETKDGEPKNWYMEAQDAASVQPRFVLLGAPGSGKSSFLRHLALCHAGAFLRRAGELDVPPGANLGKALNDDWLLAAYTPVYIEMRDLVRQAFPALPDDSDQPAKPPTIDDFWEYVQQHVIGRDLAQFATELPLLFRDGEAILLLDGLDEVPNAADARHRRQVQIKALIASIVATYPKLRIIITGRPHAYRPEVLNLPDFGSTMVGTLDSSRLRQLAHALFTAMKTEKADQKAKAFSDTLMDAVRRKKIRSSMHATPIFFTMLAALWLRDPKRGFPDTEAQLYRESVDLLLDRWTRRRVDEALGVPAGQLQPVLENLACMVHEKSQPNEDTTVFHIRDVLGILAEGKYQVQLLDVPEFLEQRAGLLVSPEPNLYHFLHRTFQEYLAACELICERPDDRRPPVEQSRRFPYGLIARANQSAGLWENVVLLAGDMLDGPREGDLAKLLVGLCQPYLEGQGAGDAALLGLQVAQRHHLLAHQHGKYDARAPVIACVADTANKMLADISLSPEDRDIAGQLLGSHPFPGHDTRQGVGLRPDGLPDIQWAEVPKLDRTSGKGDWTYQDSRHEPLETFWIAKFPVTHAQFEAFVRAGYDGFRNARWWEGLSAPPGYQDQLGDLKFPHWNHPRERVSWYDAVAFCRWLTAKAQEHPDLLPRRPGHDEGWTITLPTEEQWEKAARGHDGRQYPWGDEYEEGRANINETWQGYQVGSHYLEKTSAVGMYPHKAPDDSPYGVADLSGNVWEWCLNEYSNPENTKPGGNATRVLRGGSWSLLRDDAAASSRGRVNPDHRGGSLGFRVVVGCVPVK